MDYLDALRAWLETSALYTHFLTHLPVPLNNVYFDTLLCIGVLWLGARWISDQIHSASQRREVKNRQAEIKAKQQRLEDMQTQAEIDALNRAKVAAAQKNNMDDMMDWMRMCMMAQFMPQQQSQSAPVMSYDEYQARKAQTQAAQQESQVQAAYDTVPAPEQTPAVIPEPVPESKPKSPSVLKSIGKTLVSTASTASSALSDAAGTLADKTADMAAERAKQAEANAEKRAKEKAKKEEERLEQAKIKKEKESERARLKAEEKAQREAEKKQKAEEKAQKEVEQKAEKENETVSTPAVPESALESVSEPQPMSEPAPTPTSVPDPQAEMDFESLIAAAAKTKPISDPEETEPVTEVVTEVTEVTEKTEKINIAEIIPDSQNAPTNSFEALIAAAEKRDQVAQTLDAAKEQATDTLTRNQQILADKIKAEANTEYVKETKPQMDPERAAEIERKKKIALQAALKAKAKQEKKRR